jgi:peptidyl-prolyl cis-trans isomerase D
VVSDAAAQRVLAIQLEERQVSEAAIRPEQFAGQVKVIRRVLKEYYEKNRKQFEIPQQIRAEYVVLSLDALPSRYGQRRGGQERYEGQELRARKSARSQSILASRPAKRPEPG